MLLSEWCAREGRGAIHRLSLDTRLAYTTVHRAAKGHPTSRETADAIHKATGGQVDRDPLILGSLPDPTRRPDEPSRARPDADTIPPEPIEATS
jgi:hypothetical protein